MSSSSSTSISPRQLINELRQLRCGWAKRLNEYRQSLKAVRAEEKKRTDEFVKARDLFKDLLDGDGIPKVKAPATLWAMEGTNRVWQELTDEERAPILQRHQVLREQYERDLKKLNCDAILDALEKEANELPDSHTEKVTILEQIKAMRQVPFVQNKNKRQESGDDDKKSRKKKKLDTQNGGE